MDTKAIVDVSRGNVLVVVLPGWQINSLLGAYFRIITI